jgi:hypothetical protein
MEHDVNQSIKRLVIEHEFEVARRIKEGERDDPTITIRS